MWQRQMAGAPEAAGLRAVGVRDRNFRTLNAEDIEALLRVRVSEDLEPEKPVHVAQPGPPLEEERSPSLFPEDSGPLEPTAVGTPCLGFPQLPTLGSPNDVMAGPADIRPPATGNLELRTRPPATSCCVADWRAVLWWAAFGETRVSAHVKSHAQAGVRARAHTHARQACGVNAQRLLKNRRCILLVSTLRISCNAAVNTQKLRPKRQRGRRLRVGHHPLVAWPARPDLIRVQMGKSMNGPSLVLCKCFCRRWLVEQGQDPMQSGCTGDGACSFCAGPVS